MKCDKCGKESNVHMYNNNYCFECFAEISDMEKRMGIKKVNFLEKIKIIFSLFYYYLFYRYED